MSRFVWESLFAHGFSTNRDNGKEKLTSFLSVRFSCVTQRGEFRSFLSSLAQSYKPKLRKIRKRHFRHKKRSE